jgi:hypothetical protein
MLSGTDEAPGHVIIDPATGQKKLYREALRKRCSRHCDAEDAQGLEASIDTA